MVVSRAKQSMLKAGPAGIEPAITPSSHSYWGSLHTSPLKTEQESSFGSRGARRRRKHLGQQRGNQYRHLGRDQRDNGRGREVVDESLEGAGDDRNRVREDGG